MSYKIPFISKLEERYTKGVRIFIEYFVTFEMFAESSAAYPQQATEL